jgi:peptidyl-prolyl cis-trans isomerase SurA
MTKTLPVLLAASLALSTLSAPALAQESAALQPLDRIAAVVDEDVILQSELDSQIRQIRAQYADRADQLPPQAVLERQVLERLVLTKLQLARASSSGMRVGDDELNHTLNVIAQSNGTTVEGLAQRLAADGLGMAEFRANLREELTIQRLRQSFAQSRIVVSEGEVDAALAQASANATQYNLANILVAVPEGATAEQIATAQTKIDGVKELIDKGEMDFNAAAVRYSDSPNALEGGDLGWRTMDEIPNGFTQLLADMQKGQMIGPIRGPSGFQLLKLMDLRDAGQAGTRTVTEFQARHILIRVNANQSDAEAQAKVRTLHARLAGGADFQELAKEASEDNNTRNQGGDLGWFVADAFGPAFGEQVTAVSSDGGYSAPFRTDAGWHIVQRVGVRQTDVSDENRRAQARETIGRRKLEEEYNRFLQELRGDAFVSFRNGDGAEDTAN